MFKSYIDEIHDFLNLYDNGYFNDISNINSNTFLEHYKVYHRYKCIAKILNLRHLDIELNKSLYLKFYDKIEHLKHIHDNHAYQNAIVKFMNNVLINFEYKLNDISSLK